MSTATPATAGTKPAPTAGIGCTRNLSATGALAFGCLLLATPALAQRAEDPSRQVIVTTRIIMASNHGDGKLEEVVSPQVAASLASFPFKSYRLLQQEARPVSISRMEDFPVPGHRHLLVQPTGFHNGRVSLEVMLMEGRAILVNTALKLKNGGEFVVAGPQHEGGTLFLSIGARIPANRVRPKPGSQNHGLLLQPVESR